MNADLTPSLFGDLIPTAPAATARKAEGMARVEESAEHAESGWQDEAVTLIERYAATHGEFLTEDVRRAFGTPDGVNPKAWGPAMKAAERRGLIEACGYGLANCSNRSPRVLWRKV